MPGHEERRREAAMWFGENLRAVRERRKMSQADLAQKMAAAGHAWHQSTVYKIEHGERRTEGIEIVDLADILHVTIDRLFWSGPEANAVELVGHASGRLRQAWNETADAVARLHAARAGADRALAESHDSPYRRVQDARRGLAEEISDAELDAAIAEGTARWQREARG